MTVLMVPALMWTWDEIKDDRIRDITYTNSVIKRYYELSFNQWKSILTTVGMHAIELEGPDALDRRQEFYDNVIKLYPELMAFGLADSTGQVVLFSNAKPGEQLPNLAASENSYRSFKKALESNQVSIGESYYFDKVDDWILPIRQALRDSSGALLAINTTALDHTSLNKELEGFGFDPKYKIHLVNDAFGTTQLYFPDYQDDPEFLGKIDAREINHGVMNHTSNGLTYGVHFHPIEQKKVMCVFSKLDGLDHSIFTFVEYRILWDDFKDVLYALLLIYCFVIGSLFALFKYSTKKQNEYINQIIAREANLKSLFESTNSIIGLFDTDKRLVEFNQSFIDYAYVTDNIVLTKGIDILGAMKNREIAESFRGYLDRALSGEKLSTTVEYPGLDETFHFLLSYNPIKENGKTTGVAMFVENITALKESERKLGTYAKDLESLVKDRTRELEEKNSELKNGYDQLERALEELKLAQENLIKSEKMASLGMVSAGIGHEINNPLNFVKNGTEALIMHLSEENPYDPETVKELEEIILDGTSRIQKIVESLSHFSRQASTMTENCRIHDILDHCLTILQNSFKGKIEVIRKYTAAPLSISGNAGKLHQAFLNILSNAEQAIATKGTIRISTVNDDKTITILIEDDGMGIATENLGKISEPFFTTKPAGVGTGLGLFITYSIIEEHKGSIKVRSQMNEGTKIEIVLPVDYEKIDSSVLG